MMSNWELASVRMPIARREPAQVALLWVRWLKAAACYSPLTLRLEDLHDPERRCAEVQRLLDHCGLSESAELGAYAAALPFVNAEKQTMSRWRDDLDPQALDEIFAVPGFVEALTENGYAP